MADAQSQRFFALSQKVASQSPAQLHYRGYSGVGNEKIRGQVCMKESFECGNPEDEGQRNEWPPEELLPGLRELMEDFFQVETPRKYF